MIRYLYFKLLVITIIYRLHAHSIRNIDDDDYNIEYINDEPRFRHTRHLRPDFDEEMLLNDDDMEEVRNQIRSAIIHKIIARDIRSNDPDDVEDWSKMNVISDNIRRRHRLPSRVHSSSVYRPYIESEWGQNRRTAFNGAMDSRAGLKSKFENPNNMNLNGIHTLLQPIEEESTLNYEWKPIRIHRIHTINVGKTDINPSIESASDETVSNDAWKHVIANSNELNLDKIYVNKILDADNEESDSNEAWEPKNIDVKDTDSGIIDINTLSKPDDEETVSNNRWKLIKIDSDNVNSGNIDINTLLESNDDEDVSHKLWKLLNTDTDDIEPANEESVTIHRWKPIKIYSHSNKINVKEIFEPDGKEISNEEWKLLTKDSKDFVSNDVLTYDDIQQIKLFIEHNWNNLDQEDTFESFKAYWLKLLMMVQSLKGHNEESQRDYLLWLLENMKKSMISNPEYLKKNTDNMNEIELNSEKTTLIHKKEQMPTNNHVSTMLPQNDLIRKICKGVNQNLEDFWKMFYTYFGKNRKDTENLQQLEKLYLILTIFTQFNQASQLGLPVEEHIDQIIKIISPDIQSLGPSIFNLQDEPDIVHSNTGCVDCNENKIKDIIIHLIDKETATETATLLPKIPDYNNKYIPNVKDKWQVLDNKNVKNMDIKKTDQVIETVISVPDTINVEIKTVKPALDSNNQEAKTINPLQNSEKIHNNLIEVTVNDWKKNLEEPIKNTKTVNPMIDLVNPTDKTVKSNPDLEAETVKPMTDLDNSEVKTVKPATDLDNSEAKTVKYITDLHPSGAETLKPMTDLDNSEATTVMPITDLHHSEPTSVKTMTDLDNSEATTVMPITDLHNSEPTTVKTMTDLDDSEAKTVMPITDLHNSVPTTVKTMTDLDDSEAKTVKPVIDNLKAKTVNSMRNLETTTVNPLSDVGSNTVKSRPNVTPIINLDNTEVKTIKPLISVDNLESKTVKPSPDLNNGEATTLKTPLNIAPQHSTEKSLNIIPGHEENEWNLEGLITLRPDPDTIQADEDVLKDPIQDDHNLRAKIISLKKYYPDLREEDIKKILNNEVPPSEHIKMEETDSNDLYNPISTNPTWAKFIGSNTELPKIIEDDQYVVQPDSEKWSLLPEIENQILTKDILTDKNNPKVNAPILDKVYHYILEKTPVLHPKYDYYDPYQSVDVHEKPNATQSKSDIKIKSEIITSLDQIPSDSVEFVSHIIVMYFRTLIKNMGLEILIRKLDFGMVIRYLTQILMMLMKTLSSHGISLRIIIKVIIDIRNKLHLFQSPELETCVQKVYMAVVDIIKSVVETIKQNLTE